MKSNEKKYGFKVVDDLTRKDVGDDTQTLILIGSMILSVLIVRMFESNLSLYVALLLLFVVTPITIDKISKHKLHEMKESKYKSLMEEKRSLEDIFRQVFDKNPMTIEECVRSYLSVYGKNYSDNLDQFKRLLFLREKTTYSKVDEEIESCFESMIRNRAYFKRNYGFEPFSEFELIHEFVKMYGQNYSENQFDNLNKLLLSKGIKIHSKELLKELISSSNFDREYRRFKNKMLEEVPPNKAGYLKNFVRIYGNDVEKHMWNFYIFSKQFNLTNLDYEAFKQETKTKIFEINLMSNNRKLQLNDIDEMDGYEFEDFVAQLYQNMGYHVEQTSLSGDQGADLIVSKHGEKTAIQVKNYSSNVSNSAVQQVVASMRHYDCSSCHVVTNSYFTKSACELANSNGVKLIDRDELQDLISKYN